MLRMSDEPRSASACATSWVEEARTTVSVQRNNRSRHDARTAHLAPTIQEPPRMSPFLRTARIASAGFR